LSVSSPDVARLIKWPARHCEKFEWGARLQIAGAARVINRVKGTSHQRVGSALVRTFASEYVNGCEVADGALDCVPFHVGRNVHYKGLDAHYSHRAAADRARSNDVSPLGGGGSHHHRPPGPLTTVRLYLRRGYTPVAVSVFHDGAPGSTPVQRGAGAGSVRPPICPRTTRHFWVPPLRDLVTQCRHVDPQDGATATPGLGRRSPGRGSSLGSREWRGSVLGWRLIKPSPDLHARCRGSRWPLRCRSR
jgi:hypothetical protein